MDYADAWKRTSFTSGAPLTDEDVSGAERRWGVRFPDTLLRMLRVQNGGLLFGSEDLSIFPLAPDQVDVVSSQVIMSLDDYASRGWLLDESDLDALRDELGDSTLVFPLNTDAHTGIALNFNAGDHNAANVCYFDLESWEFKEISPTFDRWIKEFTETEVVPDEILAGQIERGRTCAHANLAVRLVESQAEILPLSPTSDASPEQVFADWGTAADRLVAVLDSIEDSHSATSHLSILEERVQAYAACWNSMLNVTDTMEGMRIGELTLQNRHPHARVSGALSQARVRGPAVYKIIRSAIKTLDDLI